MNTNAVIYARVSTKEQKEKGSGLANQIDGCQRYAKQNGLDVVSTIKEDVSGATRIAERQGGRQLMELLSNGHNIGAVIVWRLDRLSRPPEGEYSRLLTTLEQMSRLGVSIHDTEIGLVDPTDAMGALITFVKSIGASDEREAIARRTKNGRLAKAKSGKWVGNSQAPFGYRKVGQGPDARLEIDELQAGVVRHIYDMYLGRNGEQRYTIRGIARKLTVEGVETPGFHRRPGKGWYPGNISLHFLHSRRYLGEFQYREFTSRQPALAIVDE